MAEFESPACGPRREFASMRSPPRVVVIRLGLFPVRTVREVQYGKSGEKFQTATRRDLL